MKLMCISLNDVNSSDWTAKQRGCFTVKSKGADLLARPAGTLPDLRSPLRGKLGGA